MIDDPDEVNRLRIALGRISRFIDRQVAIDGMTRTQLTVLATVARAKAIGMSELAEVERLNPTMLSRIVGKLEDAGYVRRVPGAEDRRAVVVEVTAAGTRTNTKLRRLRTTLLTDRLGELPDAYTTALLAAVPALEALSDALQPVATEKVAVGR
jgi:DNA-binding MarR family transcriptional regulator